MKLVEKISEVQIYNKTCTLELIEQFKPLLKKYAYILNYEDAYYDLQAFLIELLNKINLSRLRSTDEQYIITYIAKSLYNCYILLSKKNNDNKKNISISALEYKDDDSAYAFTQDELFTVTDDYPIIEYEFLQKTLTKRESEVIFLFCFKQLSMKDIAKHYHVSIPAISQAKNKALNKLRNKILEI